MKKIKLHSKKYPGKYALVDDEDFEYLNQFKWRPAKFKNTFYALRNIYRNNKRTTEQMHRKILNIKDRNIHTDHINGNGLNNQRKNLRTVTHSQNQMNRRKYKKASSRFKGVAWSKENKKWKVEIKINQKSKHLGLHSNEIKAAKIYDKAAKELFGEFACLNFKSN